MNKKVRIRIMVAPMLFVGLVLFLWTQIGRKLDTTVNAISAPTEAAVPAVVADLTSMETNFVAVASATATNVATPVVAATNNTLVLEFRDFKLGYGQKPKTNNK